MDFGAGADLSWKQSNDRSSEMGTIVISQNLSLDGVVQDPTGEEGYGFGGWFGQVGDRAREEWAKVELDEVLRAEALGGAATRGSLSGGSRGPACGRTG